MKLTAKAKKQVEWLVKHCGQGRVAGVLKDATKIAKRSGAKNVGTRHVDASIDIHNDLLDYYK